MDNMDSDANVIHLHLNDCVCILCVSLHIIWHLLLEDINTNLRIFWNVLYANQINFANKISQREMHNITI